MIKGIGLDIISIERIEKMLIRWDDKFILRVYTQREIDYCGQRTNPAPHYAARFAAKEAVYKALSGKTGFLRWREIEVVNKVSGKPEIHLTGNTKELAEKMEIMKLHISLTHGRDYAAAQVVGEGKK